MAIAPEGSPHLFSPAQDRELRLGAGEGEVSGAIVRPEPGGRIGAQPANPLAEVFDGDPGDRASFEPVEAIGTYELHRPRTVLTDVLDQRERVVGAHLRSVPPSPGRPAGA